MSRKPLKLRPMISMKDATPIAQNTVPAEENFQIGQKIPGKGIFAGVWEPMHKEKSLGKSFNLFAAPQDLKRPNDRMGPVSTYNYFEAIQAISALRGWHGCDGAHALYDSHLYQFLGEGSYKGGWFLPTADILTKIFPHRETGSFKGTFADAHTKDDAPHAFYWSCTGIDEDLYGESCNISFISGAMESDARLNTRLRVRPVRVELRR